MFLLEMYFGILLSKVSKAVSVAHHSHRDMTKVLQMPAKMFPHLKLLCWLFMGPALGFDTKQRNSFLIIFYNKNKILKLLFILK